MAGGHRLPKGAKSKRTDRRGGRGAHRAAPRHPEPYAWLGAGAVALGMGAALASGTGVAYADDGTSGTSPGTAQSTTSTSATAGQASTAPKKKKKKPAATTQATEPTKDDTKDDPKNTASPDPEPAKDAATETTNTTAPARTHGAKSSVAKKNSVKTATADTAASKDDDATTATPAATSKVTAAAATTASAVALTTAATPAAAATPTATTAPPRAIAVPVLKVMSAVLKLMGLNTNTPLPPLDLQQAATWIWFRQLQTDWHVAPPVAGTPTASGAAPGDGTVTGNLNASNEAKLPMTYTVAVKPLLGTLTVDAKTGNYTYTPSEAARIGAVLVPVNDVFTVTISNGLSAIYSLVAVKVDPATNGMPSSPISISRTVDPLTGKVTGIFGSSSPADTPLKYTVLTPPVSGSLTYDKTSGAYTYKPSAAAQVLASLGVVTSDVFTVVATNGGLIGAPGLITVPITPMTDVPTTPAKTAQTTDGYSGLVTGTISSTDPADLPITYRVLTPTVFGTLNFDTATGAFTYKPSAAARLSSGLGVTTADGFTVVATNGTFVSSIASISVPIAIPDTPSAPVKAGQTVDPDSGIVTGTLTSTDPAGHAVTYSLTTQAVGGRATVGADGSFSYDPTDGSRTASYLAGGLSDFFTVTVSNGLYNAMNVITVPISPKSPF
ncbi:MAG: hypothetical protein HYZ39_22195 [Mycolicibacterium cosmeticum]|nr:hypothetical protein [Mycolicibacterium cosmeticum]